MRIANPARTWQAAADAMARGSGRGRDDEIKVSGVSACRTLFAVRPHDIVRVYVTPDRKKLFGELLAYCAERRLAYHIVEVDELERVAQGAHHEGICVLARAWYPSFADLLDQIGRDPACLIALDGVQNPHNLGAILRSAAHFGVTALLRDDRDGRTPPSAHRVAEGGAEVVPVVRTKDLGDALKMLTDRGFEIVTTAADARRDLYTHEFRPRTVIVMGAERDGVTPRIRRAATRALSIPGTGDVESLNVSVSAAVVLAERWRQLASKKAP